MHATQGHSSTWVSTVSVPAYRLPNPPTLYLMVPTACRSLPRSYSSHPTKRFLPVLPEYVSLSFLEATRRPYCTLPLLTLFSLNTLQIVDVAIPTVPRLSAASLCRSSPTMFPLPTVRLSPQVFPTSHLLTTALKFPWSPEVTHCVSLPPSSLWPKKVTTSLTSTVGLPFHVQAVQCVSSPAGGLRRTEDLLLHRAGWGGKLLRSSMIHHLLLSVGYFC